MVDNNISSLLFLLFCIISQNKGWVRNYIHQYWIRCKGSIHHYTIIYFFHYYYPTLMLLLEIIIEDQEYLYLCLYHLYYKNWSKISQKHCILFVVHEKHKIDNYFFNKILCHCCSFFYDIKKKIISWGIWVKATISYISTHSHTYMCFVWPLFFK